MKIEHISITNGLPNCRAYTLDNLATDADVERIAQEKAPGCKRVYVWTRVVGKRVCKRLMIPEEK